jgi:hypothetical protein
MQAAKEGWAGILHDFVRNHGRMPNVRERVEYRKTKHAPVEILNEIEWCRREAKDFMEAYEREIARSSGSGMVGDVARSLVRGYGDEIMRRRNDKADRILHGVLP